MSSHVTIRPIQTHAETVAVQQLQLDVWGIEPLEAIPAHELHAVQDSGATLLGAFDGDALVGFVFGVLGTLPDDLAGGKLAHERLKMYSVMAGVKAAYRGQDVGYRLKCAQREAALALGLKLISWTYDPLLSLNGRFNIHKLGAVCNRYRPNFHGEMGGINAGLPSDRFEVFWRIDSQRVQQRVAGKVSPSLPSVADHIRNDVRIINAAKLTATGFIAPPAAWQIVPTEQKFLVEIPADFDELKMADFSLAQQWRAHAGELFPALFAAGFVVTGFGQRPLSPPRSYYLLEKEARDEH